MEYLEDIKRIIEREIGLQLEKPRRYNFRDSTGNASSLGSDLLNEELRYVYFGNVAMVLPTDSVNEFKLEMSLDKKIIYDVSGLVNVGFSGLKNLPVDVNNIYFSFLELTRGTGTTLGHFIFDGYQFKIK